MGKNSDQPPDTVPAALMTLLEGTAPEKVVILCIGNPMRGDDAFGPAVYKRLQGRIRSRTVNGDATPENDLPRIAALSPLLVLVVDAVRSGARPGTLSVFEPENLAIRGFDTHTGSMTAVAAYLADACGARVAILAAEPEGTVLGEGMSEAAGKAAEQVAALLERFLGTSD